MKCVHLDASMCTIIRDASSPLWMAVVERVRPQRGPRCPFFAADARALPDPRSCPAYEAKGHAAAAGTHD